MSDTQFDWMREAIYEPRPMLQPSQPAQGCSGFVMLALFGAAVVIGAAVALFT